MKLGPERARELFGTRPVARMATVSPAGQPHVVPVCFVVAGDLIHTAVDSVKPKGPGRLARVRNLAAHPALSLVVDHYEDDWTRLWWARADGTARLLEGDEPEVADALKRLRDRYPIYRNDPALGPLVAIDVARWSGWRWSDQP